MAIVQIVKEKLEIDEILKKKVNNLLKFNNIKGNLKNGYIISLINTNITYIQPHRLEIKGTIYLFFNECEDVYINDLSRSIPLKDLEKIIKCTF
jgi:hypothetical protein